MRNRVALALAVVTAAMVLVPPVAGAAPGVVVLSTDGGRLTAYEPVKYAKQVLLDPAAGAPFAARGEICADPDSPRRFVVGVEPGEDGAAGWSFMELKGKRLGKLSAKPLGRLPSAQAGFGCAFLPDGSLLTTAPGDRMPTSASNGELIQWFPPFDRPAVASCTLLQGLPSPEGVAVAADGTVLLAISRTDTAATRPGIYKVIGDFPTSADDAGGCRRTTAAGARLADPGRAQLSLFINADAETYWPTDIADSGHDTWYVSNLPFGYINEYDVDGTFVRRVAKPGSSLPDGQLEAFTPYGMAVTPDGTLWVAHYGMQGTEPQAGAGQLAVVKFDKEGVPLEKERIARELDHPDGLGVMKLSRRR